MSWCEEVTIWPGGGEGGLQAVQRQAAPGGGAPHLQEVRQEGMENLKIKKRKKKRKSPPGAMEQ